MRIGKVFGTVTLSRRVQELANQRFVLVAPEDADALRGKGEGSGETLVVVDEIGAGVGTRVAFSEGREASMPFHPKVAPVDAYCAAILDDVRI